MKRIEVAAGVVRDGEGRVLICRRRGALEGLWEFPGGKREPGESYQACLERELKEELALSVRAGRILQELDQRDPEREIHFAFVEAALVGDGALELRVHGKAAWATPEELAQYPFCKTDKVFIQLGLL